jgi:hypothetical protein
LCNDTFISSRFRGRFIKISNNLSFIIGSRVISSPRVAGGESEAGIGGGGRLLLRWVVVAAGLKMEEFSLLC